ncbi:iron ABC transporter permease [Fulvimarina sp. MAC8]|uniref:FecCD family ABC transporter permease n=1 Tax=Fulvimarina sp. MAC8 TaxID=3162874 RepID=UPI0032EC4BE4
MTKVTLLLCAVLLAILSASLALGDYTIPLRDLLSLFVNPDEADPQQWIIVVDLRMPRVALAMLVGAALAVAGAITQALMRNPLAEPGLLGINAGAALAATLLIVIFTEVPPQWLPWASFGGAMLAAFAVYLLSWQHGSNSLRIVLIGVGLSALAVAATTLLTTFAPIGQAQQALIWLSGSVYLADWDGIVSLALWLLVPVIVAPLVARELDLIRFGDAAATSLGQRVEVTRAGLILLCALICGAAVAAAGPIGFVGLVAPHLARWLVGPSHMRLLPVSALVGAQIVMLADLAGRTVMAPAQLPAGLVTAIVGAPFFGWLLWRHRHVGS